MLFNSGQFILFFLPIALTGFFLAGKSHHHLRIIWLIAASMFFIGYGDSRYLILIIISIIINYYLALRITKFRHNPRLSRSLLTLGIVANLGTLGYFKYADFVIDNLNALTSGNFTLDAVILPLGISFFTFEQISYLVDAYKGKLYKNTWLSYCFFISFFPYFSAGPIVRQGEIVSQLEQKELFTFNLENLAVGITIFSIGLFKKLVLADNLTNYVNVIFASADASLNLSLIEAWSGVIAFGFQLYFDFSGYSDMAIGVARMFGLILPVNFYSPYKSLNIINFWRTWHISLSNFLKDYLYIPLGGNRFGKFRQYLNLMITMVLGGLWHGASWNFVIWGGLHGVYLVINHSWYNWLKFKENKVYFSSLSWRLIAQILTLIAVTFAWVFFRSATLNGTTYLLGSMLGVNAKLIPEQFKSDYVWFLGHIVISALIIFCLPNTSELMKNYRPNLTTDKLPSPAGLAKIITWEPHQGYQLFLAFLWFGILLKFFSAGASSFIYLQF